MRQVVLYEKRESLESEVPEEGGGNLGRVL